MAVPIMKEVLNRLLKLENKEKNNKCIKLIDYSSNKVGKYIKVMTINISDIYKSTGILFKLTDLQGIHYDNILNVYLYRESEGLGIRAISLKSVFVQGDDLTSRISFVKESSGVVTMYQKIQHSSETASIQILACADYTNNFPTIYTETVVDELPKGV